MFVVAFKHWRAQHVNWVFDSLPEFNENSVQLDGLTDSVWIVPGTLVD